LKLKEEDMLYLVINKMRSGLGHYFQVGEIIECIDFMEIDPVHGPVLRCKDELGKHQWVSIKSVFEIGKI
jgi:hypothetical protein